MLDHTIMKAAGTVDHVPNARPNVTCQTQQQPLRELTLTEPVRVTL